MRLSDALNAPKKITWKPWARISRCANYRIILTRTRSAGKGRCVFIMLNPSTADALLDDPTIKRCKAFTVREGKRKLVVVNLFTGRASKPSKLYKMEDPVGPRARTIINQVMKRCSNDDLIICAWGVPPSDKEDRKLWNRQVRYVYATAARYGHRLYALHQTKDGHPGHPLYVKSDAPLQQIAS